MFYLKKRFLIGSFVAHSTVFKFGSIRCYARDIELNIVAKECGTIVILSKHFSSIYYID